MTDLQFNGQILENLQSVIKNCLTKGLEIRIKSDCSPDCCSLEIYDQKHLVSSGCIDLWFEDDYEALAHEDWFSENYLPFQEGQHFFDTGLEEDDYYDLLINYDHHMPQDSQLMWRCKCINGLLHASDGSGRTWELNDWGCNFAIRPHQAKITCVSHSDASVGFKDQIKPDMTFMELVELCLMSQPRMERREDGSGFGSYSHGGRKLKNKTANGSTVYVFEDPVCGSVTCRIGKYFEHSELGTRWDDMHHGTFNEQPYLLDILSRVE